MVSGSGWGRRWAQLGGPELALVLGGWAGMLGAALNLGASGLFLFLSSVPTHFSPFAECWHLEELCSHLALSFLLGFEQTHKPGRPGDEHFLAFRVRLARRTGVVDRATGPGVGQACSEASVVPSPWGDSVSQPQFPHLPPGVRLPRGDSDSA